MEFIKKYYWKVFFFLCAIVISTYIHINATEFVDFLFGSLLTFAFFVGIYFCLGGVQLSITPYIIGRIISILLLLAFIYFSWVNSSFYGFRGGCHHLVAKNIFTGSMEVHCSVPPWYTTVIGGEKAREILLNNCLNKASSGYLSKRETDQCNEWYHYQADRDWTK